METTKWQSKAKLRVLWLVVKKRFLQSELGFTLVELAMVLVIIGLIVGGVLVGQDLIEASKIRATISQIQQYSAAIRTFQTKYNAIPGDMAAADATSVGFTTRAGTVGRGDGNGIIEQGAANYKAYINAGEAALFWTDLGDSGLIEGKFKGIDCSANTASCASSSASVPISSILPPVKIGQNNYFAAYYDI